VRTLRELGFKRAFVMHGVEEGTANGMDELSTLGPSHVSELFADGNIESYVVVKTRKSRPARRGAPARSRATGVLAGGRAAGMIWGSWG